MPASNSRLGQQIRAERLHALGLLDVLPPNQLSPDAISEWLACDLGSPVRERVDLNSNGRLAALLDQMLLSIEQPTPRA